MNTLLRTLVRAAVYSSLRGRPRLLVACLGAAALALLIFVNGARAGELAYAERTSSLSVTATTMAGSDTVVSSGAATYAAEKICVEFGAQSVSIGGSPGGFAWFTLWDDTTSLGSLAYLSNPAGTAQNFPVYAKRCLTPSAGSHTYIVKVYKAQTVTVAAGNPSDGGTAFPAYIRVTNESGAGGGSVAWADVTDKPTFNLSWLDDVDTTGALGGVVLKYNATDSEWQVAVDDAGGGGGLSCGGEGEEECQIAGNVSLSELDRERLDVTWAALWLAFGWAVGLFVFGQLFGREARGWGGGT